MVRNDGDRAQALRDLTEPQSENMYFYAQKYSKALGRTITFEDIPVEPVRDGLLERGLPVHLISPRCGESRGCCRIEARRKCKRRVEEHQSRLILH
jgi:hypothetical protein